MTGGIAPRPDEDAEFPPVRPTGHARVDAVLARAAELDAAPVREHPGRFEELHAVLVAELDAEPGTVPAGLVARDRPEPR